MDSASQTSSQSPYHGAGVLHQNCTNAYPSTHAEGKHGTRKSSKLQVSVTPTTMDNPAQSIPESPQSPATFGSSAGSSQPVSQSPKTRGATQIESPKSPRERLDEFLKQEDPGPGEESRYDDVTKLRNASTSPSKVQSYTQLRNVSSPMPEMRPLGHSSPPSPRSTASPPYLAPYCDPKEGKHHGHHQLIPQYPQCQQRPNRLMDRKTRARLFPPRYPILSGQQAQPKL